MKQQLVPSELLQKADKILFVAHLAIGDFAYYQNCFKAFAEQYPHIKIHVWVDELRRTRCFWRWKYLKNYALYDWLEACPFIHKVYKKTYSPSLLKQSLVAAQHEQYPLVVSLATLRPHKYARLARRLSSCGFVVGLYKPVRWYNWIKRLSYKRLDQRFLWQHTSLSGKHISHIDADWFTALFGIEIADKHPFVAIPNKWVTYAKLRFLKWGIDKKSKKFGTVIFINAFAKDKKRTWPLKNVAQLIRIIKHKDAWGDVSFVINADPHRFASTKKYFERQSINDTYVFSAEHNFFQLPAMMSLCDKIISVETSTIHLATAVNVPVVVLMRTKNPEWMPIDKEQKNTVIFARNRKDWVKNISVERVMQSLDTALHDEQT